jgi:hypothetical protein
MICLAITFLSIISIYCRIFWGADFADESFFIAMSKSFAAGRIPFKDELSIIQGSSVLLTPFAWLHKIIFTEQDYLVLYFRHIFILALSITALITYKSFTQFDQLTRTLSIFLILIFIHFNIYKLI